MTVICLASCSKKNNEKDPETTAKFLSATSFASSTWEGNNGVGTVKLEVTSTTDMTLTYYKMPIAKETEKQPVAVPVKITYTFTEADGKFSGKGDDQVNYSGTLKSTTALDFSGLSTGTIELKIKK